MDKTFWIYWDAISNIPIATTVTMNVLAPDKQDAAREFASQHESDLANEDQVEVIVFFDDEYRRAIPDGQAAQQVDWENADEGDRITIFVKSSIEFTIGRPD